MTVAETLSNEQIAKFLRELSDTEYSSHQLEYNQRIGLREAAKRLEGQNSK